MVLVGEVKVAATAKEVHAIAERLRRDAARCPDLVGTRIEVAVWVLEGRGEVAGIPVVRAEQVVGTPKHR